VGSGKLDSDSYGQLRWVILLLAIAVILPTVCLLWFISQTVKNERLAVRQKLISAYQRQLDELARKSDEAWLSRLRLLDKETETPREPIEIFDLVTARQTDTAGPYIADSVVIFDDSGSLLYPAVGKDEDQADELSDRFKQVWDIEFVEKDFAGAINVYEEIAASAQNTHLRYLALMGKVRCLKNAGLVDKAVSLCRDIAYAQDSYNVGQASASLIARARILLVSLEKESEGGINRLDLQRLISSAVNYGPPSAPGFLPMPSGTRTFSLRRALETAKESQWAGQLKPEISRAEKLLFAEELAGGVLERFPSSGLLRPLSKDNVRSLMTSLGRMVEIAEKSEWAERLELDLSKTKELLSAAELADTVGDSYPSATLFDSWPENTVRRLELPREILGIYHKAAGRIYLLLQTADEVLSAFDAYGDEFEGLDICYRVFDDSGRYISGVQAPEEQPFMKASAGKYFPGWRIELYFKDADVFRKAARRQVAFYIWTGALVILLMLVAGASAGQAVGRQIKLNRLKNDFIATVSHELKTPLASMRVLVDTLLEGRCKGQEQATEYLQLISHENERLSRLIDNFLTFSRMERNKQTFDMLQVSPAAIARKAAEAVKTKFEQHQCKFDMRINENLPDVQADEDAMVTAMVNLLDNACKYSYDDKRIKLKVFTENGSVCFSVSDNGIGLSRRAVKKIFDRFYQVDRTLSRPAGGCGLGLSIVKFVVDAHKGTISVESKPGKGSTFTIKLPAIR